MFPPLLLILLLLIFPPVLHLLLLLFTFALLPLPPLAFPLPAPSFLLRLHLLLQRERVLEVRQPAVDGVAWLSSVHPAGLDGLRLCGG